MGRIGSRRFELSDGKSNKFWQVEQDGSDLHLAWSRIGTAGQSKTKSFDSVPAAGKEAQKQIRAKQKKGYVEVEAAGSAPRDEKPRDEKPREKKALLKNV